MVKALKTRKLVRLGKIDFDYVINPTSTGKVVFGSTTERGIDNIKNMSAFMRAHTQGSFDFPGPGAYTPPIVKRVLFNHRLRHSKILAEYKQERESKRPEAGDYNIDIRQPIKRNVITPCREPRNRVLSVTPGVGTYNTTSTIEKLKLHSAFGSEHTIVPVYRIICTPVNKAQCFKCFETPQGDYFRDFVSKLDLCYPCMKDWRKMAANYKMNYYIRLKEYKKMEKFEPARYCDIYHTHAKGATVSVTTMTQKQLKKRQQIENYLFPYVKY
ncbi:uncharacterized protein LOC119675030 [Teleopsis dalmanni]|uniref:uncharacterized protein LOC119675030 n=1 Tax=Teleopsis dalmanni TaxID=139649 RepID=UPI0018CD3AE8|nr:uncharacterized protein LOC119675030 [Teleopsis dalmanni]